MILSVQNVQGRQMHRDRKQTVGWGWGEGPSLPMASGHWGSFRGEENVWNWRVWVDAQHSNCTKSHRSVHFEVVTLMLHELKSRSYRTVRMQV